MKRGPEVLYKIGLANQASFGKPLEESIRLNNGQVPVVIQMCCDVIEDAIETDGVYKTSPPAQRAEEAAAGAQPGRLDPHHVHEVASLLKGFLNRLPLPLCPPSLYPQFVAAHGIQNVDARFQRVKALFGSMPNANKMVLLHLLRHLYKVAQHSKKNKMTVSSLAAVFAPIIFKCPKEADSLVRTMADQPALAAVLTTLISYHHLLLLSPDATPSILSVTAADAPIGRPTALTLSSQKALANGGGSGAVPTEGGLSPSNSSREPPAGFPQHQPTHSAQPGQRQQPFPQNQHLSVAYPHHSAYHQGRPEQHPMALSPTAAAAARAMPVNQRLMVDVSDGTLRAGGPPMGLLSPGALSPLGGRGPPSPWAPTSSLDPAVNQVLDGLIAEVCGADFRISPGFDIITGGPDGWQLHQAKQAEQERRLAAAFGPSPVDRVMQLLAAPPVRGPAAPAPAPAPAPGPSPSPIAPAGPTGPPLPLPPDSAGPGTDGSSSASSDSDDFPTPGHGSAPGAHPGGPAGSDAAADPRRRRPHLRVNEKLLTRELNTEVPIDLANPYGCIVQRLGRRRARAQRPSSVPEMSLEELKDEKRAIKMELKNFDTLFFTAFQHPPQKRDKEPLREVYALYKTIKKAIDDYARPAPAPAPHPEAGPPPTLAPLIAHPEPVARPHTQRSASLPQLAAAPAASPAGPFPQHSVSSSHLNAATPQRSPATPADHHVAAVSPASSAPSMPSSVVAGGRAWSPAEVRQLKAEKRELKKRLCGFQAKFREEFGRDVVSKRDREPMATEYERYRELKGLLREIEGPEEAS